MINIIRKADKNLPELCDLNLFRKFGIAPSDFFSKLLFWKKCRLRTMDTALRRPITLLSGAHRTLFISMITNTS
jgi:hypothetical protein